MDSSNGRIQQRLERRARHWEEIAAHSRAQIAELEEIRHTDWDTQARFERNLADRRAACAEQERFARDARELLRMLQDDRNPLASRHLIALL